MPPETQMIQQAYKFALDPTPRQARTFASHAGGARFAYNWGTAAIIVALDARQAEKDAGAEPTVKVPSHFDLCKAWTAWKNEHAADPDPAEGERPTNTAWVGENFVGTYQAALRDAAKAWSDFFASRSGKRAGRRLGRPRFKKRGKCRDSFQVHGGTLRMDDATHVTLPKIGQVAVMSDGSLHPAMVRSAIRASHPPRTMIQIVTAAQRGVELSERKLAKARVRYAEATRAAETLPGAAAGAWGREIWRVRQRIAWAAQTVVKAEKTAARAQRELASMAGHLVVSHEWAAANNRSRHMGNRRRARILWRALQRGGDARVIRGTITRGADGLWWLSMTAEVPMRVRTAPSRAQRAGGMIGADFGVREVATFSNGVRIPNPRHLETALAELRVAQKALSRCQKDSRRREKAKARVGLIHADVARLREAALHRATTTAIRQHDVIAVEGWDVQQVMHGGSTDVPVRVRRNRNRALADAGVGMARQMLTYKGQRLGVTVLVTGPQAKTGRTCSVCRKPRTTALPPHHETFTSDQCGHVLDRRANTALAVAGWAAQELKKRGPLPSGPAKPRGGDVRPSVARKGGGRQSPVKRAASTRRSRGETGTPDG